MSSPRGTMKTMSCRSEPWNVRDAVRLGDAREPLAVVPHPHQGAAQRVHLGLAELGGAQARAADQDVGPVLGEQRGPLLPERSGDPALLDGDAHLERGGHQPPHVGVGVDHRREVPVAVDDAVRRVDPGEPGRGPQALEAGDVGLDLAHLGQVVGVGLDRLGEVEVRRPEVDAGNLLLRHFTEALERDQTPLLRAFQGCLVLVEAAHRGGPLPQCPGDHRDAVRRELLRQDGHTHPPFSQFQGCGQP